MISQSLFERILDVCGSMTVPEVDTFMHPGWLVIHKATRQGFYVDRHREPTISVSMCTEPKFFVEKFDYCIFVPRPKWALSEPASAFVTYLLEN